jgi:DNA mismatch repair ATPase MutL
MLNVSVTTSQNDFAWGGATTSNDLIPGISTFLNDLVPSLEQQAQTYLNKTATSTTRTPDTENDMDDDSSRSSSRRSSSRSSSRSRIKKQESRKTKSNKSSSKRNKNKKNQNLDPDSSIHSTNYNATTTLYIIVAGYNDYWWFANDNLTAMNDSMWSSDLWIGLFVDRVVANLMSSVHKLASSNTHKKNHQQFFFVGQYTGHGKNARCCRKIKHSCSSL